MQSIKNRTMLLGPLLAQMMSTNLSLDHKPLSLDAADSEAGARAMEAAIFKKAVGVKGHPRSTYPRVRP